MTVPTLEADETAPPARRRCFYPDCITPVSEYSPNYCRAHALEASKSVEVDERETRTFERTMRRITMPGGARVGGGANDDGPAVRAKVKTTAVDFDPILFEIRRPTWQARAACLGVDANVMVPERETREACAEAKTLCATCTVIEPCLESALREPSWLGVWGGCTSRERAALRREQRKAA